jgi:iron complex outermembrane receptor protein
MAWAAGSLLAVTLLYAPASAGAQDDPPPAESEQQQEQEQEQEEAPPAGSNIGFEAEVTVTAGKRGEEETIQEFPTSVAAPTEEVLRNRGADDLEDVSTNVAGFSVQNLGPGQSQVSMRGVSAGQIVRDQPGVKEQVGIYLDESVISLSLFTPDLDLFDLSRVEVLRGPQGTLFGSGSLSGTVRYITNQPELGVSSSVAELTLNSIDDGSTGGSAKFAVNQPLGDTAAVRVTAYYTGFPGYMDAVQPGLRRDDDVNDGDRLGARIALRFEPNEQLTVTPRLIYQEIDMNGWNRIDDFNILGNPFTTSRPAVDLGEREQFIQFEEPFTDEFLLADLNLEYRFGAGMAFTSVTSYSDRDLLVVRDATALTASITGGSIGLPESIYTIDAPLDDATTAQVLTQELRVSSVSDRLSWVGGVFYSSTDREYGQSLLVSGFQDASGIPTQGLRAGRDVLFFSDLAYDLEQRALFGELTWSINERFDLTGGLRYYDFEEDREQIFDGIFAHDNTGTAVVSTPGSTEADGFAPRFVASYAVSDNTTLNAQVAKGFRLGGINDPLNVPLCTPEDLATFGGRDRWEDEVLWNYELGSKSTIMGGRGTFNVAVYHMDIEDLQATVTAGSCSSRVIFNVPEARNRGAELELAVAPNPHFDFAVSASYNDSELQSTLTSGGQVIAGIQAGNRLPSVPEFQASAAATVQRTVFTDWLGFVTATYQHVGSRFTQIGDQAAGFGVVNLNSFAPNTIGGPLTAGTFRFDPELPAYDIVNLRVGALRERWEVAFFLNNVTDERALLSLDQERGTRARVGYLTNQPRTFGLTTRIHF